MKQRVTWDVSMDPILALQYHLFAHTLYEAVDPHSDSLNILVVGFHKHAQAFLDLTLSLGQSSDRVLNVLVATSSSENVKRYLESRASLPDFFNVAYDEERGSMEKQGLRHESYGNLTFLVARQLERDFLRRSYKPDYAFVSLNNDAENYSWAEQLNGLLGDDCAVNFVCENVASLSLRDGHGFLASSLFRPEKQNQARLYPIDITLENAQKDERFLNFKAELERMALNTHRLWDRELNRPMEDVVQEFNIPYNYRSCILNVLAIQSKLDSVGIRGLTSDSKPEEYRRAAQEFAKVVAAPENADILNKLICVEHRRWVAEKLCDGWTPLSVDDCLVLGDTKDKKHKRHLCLTFSRSDRLLAENPTWWDEGTAQELDQLDDLDRTSVELYRLFRQEAQSRLQEGRDGVDRLCQSVEPIVAKNRSAKYAFEEWKHCLNDIRTNMAIKTLIYHSLKSAFERTLGAFEPDEVATIRDEIQRFETAFYPVKMRAEKRDWKGLDVTLVENIPFTLAYSDNLTLAIPLKIGTKTDIFQNIAAATVVNPSLIVYLGYLGRTNDLATLYDVWSDVMTYLDKKNIRARVDFVLPYLDALCGDLTKYEFEKRVADELKLRGGNRLRSVYLIGVDQGCTAPKEIAKSLKSYESKSRDFILERNYTQTSSLLEGGGIYSLFPTYSFNSRLMQFEQMDRCDILTYIHKSPHITVDDMTAFNQLTSQREQPDFFYCYRGIWSRYCANPGIWKKMCATLRQHCQYDLRFTPFYSDIRYYSDSAAFSAECLESLTPLMNYLVERGCLKETAREKIGSETYECYFRYVDDELTHGSFDTLFELIKRYSGAIAQFEQCSDYYDQIRVILKVNFVDSLDLREIICQGRNNDFNDKGMRQRRDCIVTTLQTFVDFGLIDGLVWHDDWHVSFYFTSAEARALLTVEGKALELYTYHRAANEVEFDDVACSFTLNLSEDCDLRNEIDCVVTKGFKALFVECKARPRIEQDFYRKIHDLATRYGVNARAALVIDSQAPEEKYPDLEEQNDSQRQRGVLMGVETIYLREDIDNIGAKLLEIIDKID
ncbi:MAG: hypothetical protein Q4G03_04840 [Planctomycetia bacterium]|nr:hypothetical protein [Planctomycetia bacterium]